MRKRVLVFPAGSEIGLEIHRSVAYSTHFELIGGSSVDDHARYVYKNYIGGLPSVDEDGFVDALNGVIERLGVEFVIPAHDSVGVVIARASARGQLRCRVVGSPLETCELTRSKSATYERFAAVLRVPTIFDPRDLRELLYPVFLKPDIGQGAKGTHIARTAEDTQHYLSRDPALLVLEYLPGTEYTVDCFTDREGRLLFCEGRSRSRIQNGISITSATVVDDRFREIAAVINDTLSLSGVWFFQVKEDREGTLVLLEIGPRVAGTMAVARCRGVNLVLLSLFDALGHEVTVFANDYRLTVDRALGNAYAVDVLYKHLYLDLDDLVIFDGEVNPTVMAFVFQCINRGVKVHLLTRHRGELDHTLHRFRLTGIFDEVIQIADGDEKCDYISELPAIFIDDSASERRAVSNALGIPVFDSHMLEALIDPRS